MCQKRCIFLVTYLELTSLLIKFLLLDLVDQRDVSVFSANFIFFDWEHFVAETKFGQCFNK